MSNTNKPRRTPQETQAIVAQSLRRRYWAERRFRSYGLAAVDGRADVPGLPVRRDFLERPRRIPPGRSDSSTSTSIPRSSIRPGTRKPDDLHAADYQALIRAALKTRFPDVEGRAGHAAAHAPGQRQRHVRRCSARVISDPRSSARRAPRWLLASDAVDLLRKGTSSVRCPRQNGRSATSSSAGSTSSQARRRAGPQVQQDLPVTAAIRASPRTPASGAPWSVRSSPWC